MILLATCKSMERPEVAARQAEAAGIDAKQMFDLIPADYNLTWLEDGVMLLDGAIFDGAFKHMRQMLAKYKGGSFELRIHSPGGNAMDAVAMMNYLMADGRLAMTRNIGMAFSAASYLFLAAQQRCMDAGSIFGIHDAWGLAVGNADEMRAAANMVDEISAAVAAIYEWRCGSCKEGWRNLMREVKLMGGKEAHALGVATEHVGDAQAMDDDEANDQMAGAERPDMSAQAYKKIKLHSPFAIH